MYYVRVFVADNTFHGKEVLTYSCAEKLSPGQVVRVPLKNKSTLGIILHTDTVRPRFAVKPVSEVLDVQTLPIQALELLKWMNSYYPTPIGAIANHFVPTGLKGASEKKEADRTAVLNHVKLPPLTDAQKTALSIIKEPGFHLLHGETGSGKTRIYIELALRSLHQKKSSIILTPEIGLTSQLAQNFYDVFGEENVVVLHSRLSPATRKKLWLGILGAISPIIVIGARSALFAPAKNVGFIALDESHDGAYKQDSAPYHHASTIAAKLAALHKATLVLGSATPLVADYYIAKAKQRPVIYLKQRMPSTQVSVSVVDRRQKPNFSKSPQLSDQLLDGIKRSLDKQEQSLVFLNRRGTARVILCEECGWQALCPRCDLPLTYHADTHSIVCHSCNFRQATPTNCPDCQNPSILFKSAGTKAIVDQLERHFPGAKIQRFDTDNKKNERLETWFDKIKDGQIDILVGTQTIAKGLDLPKLSFVGVVDAETSLSFPDFSAAERSYQLLSQVLGRVGRGHRNGEAVVQTYAPDNPMLKAAIEKNWNAFYEKEIVERKTFNFPPFCFLLKITCGRKTAASAESASLRLSAKLRSEKLPIIIEGPAPSFHEKHQDNYQWQIVVKSKTRSSLLRVIEMLPAGTSYDIDPLNLL